MIENLQERVKIILALCQSANETISKWGSPEQKQADKAFWDAVMALDKEAGEGVQPGRFIQIPFSDSYARYIVARVGKKTSKLIHLNYMCGYRSPIVSDRGEICSDELEGRIMFEDTMRLAFDKVRNRRQWSLIEAANHYIKAV